MTAIRHRVFMPPKMQKVPKMTLPDFRTKRRAPVKPARRACIGGPWDGVMIKGTTLLVVRIGDSHGRYVFDPKDRSLRWQDVQPTSGIGIWD